jgi:diacylglycerol kinase (ATP)
LLRVLRSFPHAFAGVGVVARSQPNAWVHALATLVVSGMAAALRVDRLEWCLLLLAVGMVWAAEAANTAIECLADAVHPDPHPLIGRAKDVGAGAVLLASMAAAGAGMLVFVPRLMALAS